MAPKYIKIAMNGYGVKITTRRIIKIILVSKYLSKVLSLKLIKKSVMTSGKITLRLKTLSFSLQGIVILNQN